MPTTDPVIPQIVIIELNDFDQRDLILWLGNVLSALENYMPAQNALRKEFPALAERRVPLIGYMYQNADKLDKHCRNCDIATIAGSSAGILGSIAVVAATALTLATGGASAPLLVPAIGVAGGVTAGVGGSTTFGTYVAKRFIEKGQQDRINTFLQEDKEYVERIFPFIRRTAELEQAVQETLNFYVFQGLMTAFNDDPETNDAIRRDAPMRELPQGIKNFIDDLPVSEEQKQRLKTLVLQIIRSLEPFRLFRKVISLFAKMAGYISIAYRTIDGLATFFRLTDATIDVGTTVSNVVRSTQPATRLAAALGLVSAVSVAIDIWVLVSAAKSMANGSKSELARRIRNTAKEMQTELTALEQIYAALTV